MGVYQRMELAEVSQPPRRSHLVTCVYRVSVPLEARGRLESYVTTVANDHWKFTEEWFSRGSVTVGKQQAQRQLELAGDEEADHPILGLRVVYGPVHGNSPSDVKRLLKNAGITDCRVVRVGVKEHASEGCRHPDCVMSTTAHTHGKG